MAVRFNKTLVVDACRNLAEAICQEEKFNDRTGTSQLRMMSPRASQRAQDAEAELIRKAVEYGRAEAFLQVARWIEDGTFKDQVK